MTGLQRFGLDGDPLASFERNLRELRAAGRIDEALKLIERTQIETSLQAFECHYARKDYDSCAAALQGLPDSAKVLSRMIYLYAHAPEYRDEAALLSAAQQLGYDSPHVVAALALSACQEGSIISAEDVYQKADAILAHRDLQYATVYDAYLLLSCGRLASAQKDFDRALNFLDRARIAYPQGCYHVQHAEIHMARADVFEAKGDKGSASNAVGQAIIQLTLQSNSQSTDTTSKVMLGQALARYKALEASRLGDLIIPSFERAVLGDTP